MGIIATQKTANHPLTRRIKTGSPCTLAHNAFIVFTVPPRCRRPRARRKGEHVSVSPVTTDPILFSEKRKSLTRDGGLSESRCSCWRGRRSRQEGRDERVLHRRSGHPRRFHLHRAERRG